MDEVRKTAVYATELLSLNRQDTFEFGEKFSKILKRGDVICVTGNLGAGKTVFIKGIGKGLNIQDNITSPTFVLATKYEGSIALVHVDMYRLNNANEVEGLGLDEVSCDSVLAVEWGERFLNELPRLTFHIEITSKLSDEDSRIIKISTTEYVRSTEIIEAFRVEVERESK